MLSDLAQTLMSVDPVTQHHSFVESEEGQQLEQSDYSAITVSLILLTWARVLVFGAAYKIDGIRKFIFCYETMILMLTQSLPP